MNRRPFGDDLPLGLMVAGKDLIGIAIHRTDDVEAAYTSVWRSRDGRDWDPMIKFDDRRLSVFHIGAVADRWVAITPYGPIQTSKDGVDWSDTSFGQGTEKDLLVNGPAGLVVPGNKAQDLDGTEISRQSMFLTSDGVTFHEAVLEDGRRAEVTALAASATSFVALGWVRTADDAFHLAAWWSTDGETWTRAWVPANQERPPYPTAATAWNQGFVAVGVDEAADETVTWWSPDGRAWVVLEGAPRDWVSRPLVVDGDRLLIYGSHGVHGPPIVWEGNSPTSPGPSSAAPP